MLSQTVLCLIPCRKGSKRLPGKNMRLLNGRPLIDYTLQLAMSSERIDKTLLSTDDPVIAEHARTAGLEVPFMRPAHLAEDATTTADVAVHALDWVAKNQAWTPDILVVLQVTSPLRPTTCIDEAIEVLRREPDAEAVIGASRLHVSGKHLYKKYNEIGLMPLAPDSDDEVFVPNGAIYAIRTSTFMSARSFIPERTRCIRMNAIQSIDIDTLDDFNLAAAAIAATSN